MNNSGRSSTQLTWLRQGISMNSALKSVEGPVADEWLMVAEFALQALNSCVERFSSHVEPNRSAN